MSWKAILLALILATSTLLYCAYCAIEAWNQITIEYPLERKPDGSVNLQ